MSSRSSTVISMALDHYLKARLFRHAPSLPKRHKTVIATNGSSAKPPRRPISVLDNWDMPVNAVSVELLLRDSPATTTITRPPLVGMSDG
jgi:hypothetical protein